MNATTPGSYLNSPVIRNCQNCAHRARSEHGVAFDKCLRFQAYCAHSVRWEDHCSHSLKEWRPIPPRPSRRSLRKWLHDIFLA